MKERKKERTKIGTKQIEKERKEERTKILNECGVCLLVA